MTETYFAALLYGLFIAVVGVAVVRPPLERAIGIVIGFPLVFFTLGWPGVLVLVPLAAIPWLIVIVVPVALLAPAVFGFLYFRELHLELAAEKLFAKNRRLRRAELEGCAPTKVRRRGGRGASLLPSFRRAVCPPVNAAVDLVA